MYYFIENKLSSNVVNFFYVQKMHILIKAYKYKYLSISHLS